MVAKRLFGEIKRVSSVFSSEVRIDAGEIKVLEMVAKIATNRIFEPSVEDIHRNTHEFIERSLFYNAVWVAIYSKHPNVRFGCY